MAEAAKKAAAPAKKAEPKVDPKDERIEELEAQVVDLATQLEGARNTLRQHGLA